MKQQGRIVPIFYTIDINSNTPKNPINRVRCLFLRVMVFLPKRHFFCLYDGICLLLLKKNERNQQGVPVTDEWSWLGKEFHLAKLPQKFGLVGK